MICYLSKDKDISIKNRSNQVRRVLYSIAQNPKTMLEISVDTGILRANICRYIATLEKLNKVVKTDVRPCTYSKHRAGVYSLTTKPHPND